jgi:hypothetical protein
VFENRVLRGIFGPKREKVEGGWRRLHNEELHNLYNTPNVIRVKKSRRLRWTGHLARTGQLKSACEVSVGKSEVKRARKT